jgi:hypothetical protein
MYYYDFRRDLHPTVDKSILVFTGAVPAIISIQQQGRYVCYSKLASTLVDGIMDPHRHIIAPYDTIWGLYWTLATSSNWPRLPKLDIIPLGRTQCRSTEPAPQKPNHRVISVCSQRECTYSI